MSQVNGGLVPETNGQYFSFQDNEHPPKLFSNLNKLRKNKQFCDVVLQMGMEKDVHEIHAHKAVLASASPYLFDLLNREEKQSKATAGLCQLKLGSGFDMEAFSALIDYSYTAQLEAPMSKMKQVFVVANKLKMHRIARVCGEILVEGLTAKNCIGIRTLPGLISDPDLLVKVDNFIKQNIADVMNSKELASLPAIKVEILREKDERNIINSKRLCDLVLDWIRHDLDDLDSEENQIPLYDKVHMLYKNHENNLRDCSEIVNGEMGDSELVQNYKKMHRIAMKKPKEGPQPAISRHFLYSKSESQSSLSSISDSEENEWKVISATNTGDYSVMGLLVLENKLTVLSVIQRKYSPEIALIPKVDIKESYTMIPVMSSPRGAMGVAEWKEKLFVCGGYDKVECMKTVEVYDPKINQWASLETMRVNRARFDITVVNDRVYALCGCDGTNELDSSEVFNPETEKWSKLAKSPVFRANAGVCNVDGRIYVVGGWNGKRGLRRCDVYDPQTNQWNDIAPLSVGRYQAGVAAMNGDIYAVGGCDTWKCFNTVERYNPSTNTWTPSTPMSTSRRGCGVATYNGKLYVVGGHNGFNSLCTVEIFDPQTDTWSVGPSLTSCRANVGVALVGEQLFAVGGFTGKIFLNTVEYLDCQNNEWTTFVPHEKNSFNNHNEKNGHVSIVKVEFSKLINGTKCSKEIYKDTNGSNGLIYPNGDADHTNGTICPSEEECTNNGDVEHSNDTSKGEGEHINGDEEYINGTINGDEENINGTSNGDEEYTNGTSNGDEENINGTSNGDEEYTNGTSNVTEEELTNGYLKTSKKEEIHLMAEDNEEHHLITEESVS